MREWLEMLVTFLLLTAAVAVGTIAAHAFMYVFSFLFYILLGF